MADYNAICQMLFRYCYALDEQDIDGVKACFAKDITIDGLAPQFRGLQGEGIVNRYAENMQKGTHWARHSLNNIFIVEDRGDEADVRAYVTLYRIEGNNLELELTGTYLDTIVLEDGEWKIRHRVARMDVGPWQAPRG